MSESKKHGGFSFQLSETPPPARTEESAPLGDLDLDLDDFGAWDAPVTTSHAHPQPNALPPQAPAAVEPVAQAETPQRAISGSAPPAKAPQPATSEPVIQTETSRPLISDPAQGISDVAPEPASKPTRAPIQADAPSAKETAPSAKETAPSVQAKNEASTAMVQDSKRRQDGSRTKPKIKKIQFPATGAKKTDSMPVAEKLTAPAKPKSQTRFSESISAPAVSMRPDLDSEPPPLHPPSGEDLDIPGDLPNPGRDLISAEQSWGSDTPSAKEIWKSARKTWNSTAKNALVLGGRGMRASQDIARDVNQKLRNRLETAAQEKQARAELRQSAEENAAPLNDELCSDVSTAKGPKTSAPSGSPVVGRFLLDVGKAAAKKVAAPLAAVAAASIVYMGGTHLLGGEEGIALSRASEATEIPDLGVLEEKDAKRDEKGASEKKERPASNSAEEKGEEAPDPADSEMKTEVTEMPEGLSWPGKGMIEVVTSEEELIYVDSVFTGRGPLRRIPVSPGEHEISIRSGGTKRTGTVNVQVNKNTRAVFKSE